MFVYVLKSLKTGRRYIGQTKNLEERIIQHNRGHSPYTKSRGPWKVIYQEAYDTRSEAIKRERFLKSGKGREFLDNLAE